MARTFFSSVPQTVGSRYLRRPGSHSVDWFVVKINVAVLFGGKSVEHEVSVISAVQAMGNLNADKYEVIPVYISKNNELWYGSGLRQIESYRDLPGLLKTCQRVSFNVRDGRTYLETNAQGLLARKSSWPVDVAFPIVHGTNVEDGALQGFLETVNLPYVGPDVVGSAVGMDKHVQKIVLAHAGVPVLDALRFSQLDQRADAIVGQVEERLSYPVIVKPANLGSSVGISRADNAQELRDALELAFSFARYALVEPAVPNLREINCAVLGDADDAEASECEEPVMTDAILSYQDKYVSGGKTDATKAGMASLKRRIPADLTPEQRERIRQLAVSTFTALDLAGVTRVDFLMDGATGEVWVNEVNTIPGSLAFYLWEPVGVSYPALLDRLISLALKRQRAKEDLVYTFDTNILANASFSGKAGKTGKAPVR